MYWNNWHRHGSCVQDDYMEQIFHQGYTRSHLKRHKYGINERKVSTLNASAFTVFSFALLFIAYVFLSAEDHSLEQLSGDCRLRWLHILLIGLKISRKFLISEKQ